MKLLILIASSFVVFIPALLCQTPHSIYSDTTILADPLIPPSFPGGSDAFTIYLEENFNWTQKQKNIHGKVFVEFYVDVDGSIQNINVVRGLCDPCDLEAVRLVKEMPTWNPATIEGKKVKLRMILPIQFGLK